MKQLLFALIFALLVAFGLSAQNNTNGDQNRKKLELSSIQQPKPRFADVSDPIAMYNSATDVLTVTLDATYYGEYTITIESTLTTVDYYPTSATTVIPLTSADNNVSIYIESDDCGSLYGLTAASEWRRERGFQHFSGNSEI